MTELQTPAPTQTMPPTRLAPRKPSRKKLIRRVIAIVVAAAILGGIIFGMWFLVFRKADSQGDIYFEYASIGSIQSTAQGSGSASAKESAITFSGSRLRSASLICSRLYSTPFTKPAGGFSSMDPDFFV